MGFMDSINYTYNVLGSGLELTIKMGEKILQSAGITPKSTPEYKLPPNLQDLNLSKLVHNGGCVVRVAAVCGATAVIIGAYGAHTLFEKKDSEERIALYERANKYHFYHSLAILGAGLSSYPKTATSFLAGGIILFSGTCYYHAFTGDKRLKKLTPVGGVFLILGWLTMLL